MTTKSVLMRPQGLHAGTRIGQITQLRITKTQKIQSNIFYRNRYDNVTVTFCSGCVRNIG